MLPKGQTYIWNAPSPYVYNMTVLESDGLKPATPAKLCMVKPRSLEQVAERRLDSSLPLNISIVAHTRFSNKQILVVTSELKLFFIVELHDTLMQRGTFQVTQVGQLAPGERAFIYELNAT